MEVLSFSMETTRTEIYADRFAETLTSFESETRVST